MATPPPVGLIGVQLAEPGPTNWRQTVTLPTLVFDLAVLAVIVIVTAVCYADWRNGRL